MSPFSKFVLMIGCMVVFIFFIVSLGCCSLTFMDACTGNVENVSIAQYEQESTPDIHDEV